MKKIVYYLKLFILYRIPCNNSAWEGRQTQMFLKKRDYTNHQFINQSRDKFSPSQKIKYQNVIFFYINKIVNFMFKTFKTL